MKTVTLLLDAPSDLSGGAFLFGLVALVGGSSVALLLLTWVFASLPDWFGALLNLAARVWAWRRWRGQLHRALPANLAPRARAFIRLRARVEEGRVSEWSPVHQATGMAFEEGYRMVYQRPTRPVEVALAEALSQPAEQPSDDDGLDVR